VSDALDEEHDIYQKIRRSTIATRMEKVKEEHKEGDETKVDVSNLVYN